MTTGEYNREFYNFIMNVECSGYNFSYSRPITDFYIDLQELNKPVLIIFIERLIIDNIDQNVIEYSSSTLFTMFNSFIEYFNNKYVVTLTEFIIDIKKLNEQNRKNKDNKKYNIRYK